MKSKKEVEELYLKKLEELNDKDNTDRQNDIIYGEIIDLKWVLEEE